MRYLISRKSHSAVNIISYVAMAGLALAATAMVVVLSVFNGFTNFTSDRLEYFEAPLQVSSAQSGRLIAHADSLATVIAAVDGVTLATPVVEERAYAIAPEGGLQMPLIIKGVVPDSPSIDGYDKAIIDGVCLVGYTPAGLPTAIISVDAANSLMTVPASSQDLDFDPPMLKLYVPRRLGRLNPSNPSLAFRTDSVVVAGVYRTERQEFDIARVILPLDMARSLLQYNASEASAIDIAVDPSANPEKVSKAIASVVGSDYRITDRIQRQEHAFRMIKVEKWITLLMLIFILLIASFNILSTLAMLIVDKRPNRSILLAMGLSRSRSASIFAWLSFLITAGGGIIGILLGSLLAFLQQNFGLLKLHAEGTQLAITAYPCGLFPTDLLIVAAIILTIAALTSLVVRTALTSRKP